jgi:hypothetical protein
MPVSTAGTAFALPGTMNRVLRRITPFLALALAAALAACGATTRVVYDSADPMILMSIERHLALEGGQWKLARTSIARFHAWHRRSELPRYAELLDDAAGRVRRGLARSDVQWGVQAVRTRYAALVEAAVRESMPLLDTLDAENVATLERRFAQENAKRVRERLSGDATKRRAERVKAVRKRLEDWTGPLGEAQVELVARYVDATAGYPPHAHEVRLRRQRELVEMLGRAVQADSPPRPADLQALFLAWGLGRTPEARGREEHFVQLLLDLDRSLTAAQRAQVVERLTGYAQDARALALDA